MLETGPHAPVTNVAQDARTLGDMFRVRARRSGDAPALYEKRGGAWEKISWRGFYQRAASVLRGLRDLGLASGDRVAILGDTKVPWGVYDLGAQLGGFVSLGVYPKQSVEQVRYILEHSDTRVIFVDNEAEATTVIEASAGLEELLAIVPWSEALYTRLADADPRVTSPARFAGEPLDEDALDASLASVDPDATAILVYTSGTTGPPKGAMITHRNILSLLSGQNDYLTFYQDDISLSFLPMAHSAERILAFYGRVSTGVATAYATSTATVLDELKEVEPTLFGSVPRIFEKAHAKAYSELGKKPAIVQKIAAWAVKVGTARVELELAHKPVPATLRLKNAIADRLVFRKIRAAFGGRIRFFITGAAPIAREILNFFWAAGLPIYEAYGMTEATVITHINRPGETRLGSVGRLIPPMECKIAEDGEILVSGPFVFKGYYKDEEATARAVVDGWLQTGDIGRIDEDGYLTITDRKKHLIITAGGKNLAPANIEKALRETTPLISQVHAHGDRRHFVSALVAPSPIETLEVGVAKGIIPQSELDARTKELMANPTSRTPELEAATAKVVAHEDFRRLIREAVGRGNAKLAQVERVRKFAILDRDFSQEHGEMTPTMKLKRKSIEEHHQALFDRIYGEEGFGLEPIEP